VRLGDPEQLADHRARQRLGEVGDDVHRRRALDAIQQRVDDRVDTRPEGLHGARREGVADGLSEAGVGRRVAEQHRLPGSAVRD
jgi:hypothetical protein